MVFKRIMALVLTLAMLCSCFVFAADAPKPDTSVPAVVTSPLIAPKPTQEELNKAATGFTDILPDAPYAEAVKKLVDFGIINGYEDGTFKPEGEVTRAEMCKMINLTLGYTDFEGVEAFPDVAPTNWYYTYALAAKKAGYVEGYEDNTFRGSNNITRQEVCAILNRLLKPMDLPIPVTITDPVANWARPHVEMIVKNFIMPLEENNTFRATENLKRHELATVLANMAIGPVKKIEAEVRFFVNGEQYGETQTVEVGKTAVEPEAPALPGEEFVFDGWRQIGSTDVVDVASLIVVSDVDYEAVFSKLTHTVTLYSRGAVFGTLTVNHNGTIAPKNPEAEGYEFVGWSMTDGGETIKLSETKITEDLSLYAVFEKESSGGGGGGGGAPVEDPVYKVKFYVNGDLYSNQNVSKNASPKAPKAPELEGKNFIGWSFDVDGEIENLSSIKVTKALTFYAVFEDEVVEPETFTVTYYVDGKKYETEFVDDGESPEGPANPEKDGYVFKYWSKTEGGSEVKLGYVTITSNTNFYAVFEKEVEEVKYFYVTFMVDGNEHAKIKVAEGDKASAPTAPRKDGYSFKGWSKSEGGSVTSVSGTVTEDVTYYAVFEKITYTVTFVVDGSTYATKKVDLNDSPDVPENPSKDGYIFKGWAEREGGETVNVGAVTVTSNLKYYAVFEEKVPEKKNFTVKFIVDGRNYDSQVVVEGESISMPKDPSKIDYNFVGWSKTNGGEVTEVVMKPTANATYYAVFEEIKKFNVTFYVNGVLFKKVTVVDGDTAFAPANPSVDGYTFKGWSMTEGGSVVIVGSVEITKDTSFYAVLEEKVVEKPTYTVTFVVDGRTYDSQSVEDGKKATEPDEPAKDGFTFVGWSRTNGGAVVNVSDITIKTRTTFYAVFEENEPEPVYYKVTFYVEGDEYDKQSVLEGEYPKLPKDPEMEGYEFLGWSKTEGGNTVNPDAIEVKSNLKYYAVFEEIKEEVKYYKVVFWFDGEFYMPFDVAAGDSLDAPVTPKLEDENAIFLGWSLSDSNSKDKIIEVSDIVINQNTDFYSVIIKNPNDPVLMEKLERGKKQLAKIKANGLAASAISKILSCISCVIDDANSGEYITKNYVSKEYGDSHVDPVKDIVNNKMTSTERSNFVNLVTNPDRIDQDVQDFLIDYFDIDTNI